MNFAINNECKFKPDFLSLPVDADLTLDPDWDDSLDLLEYFNGSFLFSNCERGEVGGFLIILFTPRIV